MPFDSQPTTTTNPLAACHEAQIDALTLPGLSYEERVRRFAEAAGFDEFQTQTALIKDYRVSPAKSVWWVGEPQKSIFANLPGCRCPVQEGLPGVPHFTPWDWQPTRSDLEVFARIQQERRSG